MASEEGSTAVEVERRLGISQGIISRWKKQLKAKAEEAFPGTGHFPPSLQGDDKLAASVCVSAESAAARFHRATPQSGVGQQPHLPARRSRLAVSGGLH